MPHDAVAAATASQFPAAPRPQLEPSPIIREHQFSGMGEPNRLKVPSLGIDAQIVATGLTASGGMAVPDSLHVAGWYARGVMPGNPGKAVLTGHTGYPAQPTVFRRFEQLRPGDTLDVEDKKGSRAIFEVIERATYTPEQAPRERIFGDSPTARLAFITCSGTWDAKKQQYSERLVIYAVRKE